MRDVNIVVAGAAGEGVDTIGEVLARSLLALGWAVFSWKEYESRIRGGNNRYSLRVGESPVNAPLEPADLLLALNPRALAHYRALAGEGATILAPPVEGGAGENVLSMDFGGLAEERLGKRIFANTVAAGAVFAALGADLSALSGVLETEFQSKGPEVVRANVEAARIGYEAAGESCGGRCSIRLGKRDGDYILAGGNEAVALGAALAGCRFMAAYPMTPSTGIITFFHRHLDRLGILNEQAEDEIAAVNMALGASFAGARAMTATSGGGFALMVEAVSLSGMTETPLVVVLGQRPAPATGLPTRTSQGDLLFAVHAGHGEFAKAVLSATDPRHALRQAARAFDLADRFQTMVILLTDQFLADGRFCFSDMGEAAVRPVRHLADPETIQDYARYRITESGVSPRLYPGQSRHLVCADSDEHDEYGHITEDLAGTALPMMKKRLAKVEGLREEMEPPLEQDVEDADLVLVGYGSSLGAMEEAVRELRDRGVKAGMILFTDLWPLPRYEFPRGRRLVTVENHLTPQLARHLRGGYDVSFSGHVQRGDGLPLTAAYIAQALERGEG